VAARLRDAEVPERAGRGDLAVDGRAVDQGGRVLLARFGERTREFARRRSCWTAVASSAGAIRRLPSPTITNTAGSPGSATEDLRRSVERATAAGLAL